MSSSENEPVTEKKDEKTNENNDDNNEEEVTPKPKPTFRFTPRNPVRWRGSGRRESTVVQNENNYFLKFSDSLLEKVFQKLPKSELKSLCLVCSKWRDVLWGMATEV